MNIFKNIFPSAHTLSQEAAPQEQYAEGCPKCGHLSFEHDSYFNEYSCKSCGWMVSEKPAGEIRVIEKKRLSKKEKDSDGGMGEKTKTSISLEEMSKIIQEYGEVMVNNSPQPGGVADVSNLPYAKEKIKESIIKALQTEKYTEMLEALRTGYLQLAHWQEGVGETKKGFDFSAINYDFSEIDTAPEEVKNIMKSYQEQEKEMQSWREKIKREAQSLQEELIDLELWE